MENSVKKVKVSGVLVAAGVVIIIASMKMAADIITPFLMAIFLSIISAQPINWLQKKGLNKALSVGLVLFGLGGLFALLGGVLGKSLADFSTNLPVYETKLSDDLSGIVNWLEGFGFSLNEVQLSEVFNPGKVMNFTANALNGLAGLMSNAFIIALIMLFFLLEMESFGLKFRAIFKDSAKSSSQNISQIIHSIRHYLGIKTITSLVTGGLISLWLWAQGVDYAILWGLIAFLMNYIPNIGSLIAAIPAILFSAVQLGGGGAFWTMIGFLLVNVIIGSIIEPRVMGRGMGLSTLVVFLSLIFWGWVLGTIGMFLSVPLTIAAKIALKADDDSRWLAIILGTEEDAKEELEV